MKIGFVYSKSKVSGLLTKFFTGSYCYHVFIVDEDRLKMYDMNLLVRRRKWPHYGENTHYVLVDSPVSISSNYLESMLDESTDAYGWRDYLLFGLRPLYHLFGKSTRNAKGVICSEMIYNILWDNGWDKTFPEVPSPADLEALLVNGSN